MEEDPPPSKANTIQGPMPPPGATGIGAVLKSMTSSTLSAASTASKETEPSEGRRRPKLARTAKVPVSYSYASISRDEAAFATDSCKHKQKKKDDTQQDNTKRRHRNIDLFMESIGLKQYKVPAVVTPQVPHSGTGFGDIVCGGSPRRDGLSLHRHEPNMKFRRLLHYHYDLYDDGTFLSSNGKRMMCVMILEYLFEQDGRLIRYNKASGCWETLSHVKCYEKVSQTFRDLRCSKKKERQSTFPSSTKAEIAAWEPLRASIQKRLQQRPSKKDSKVVASLLLPPTATHPLSGSSSRPKKRSALAVHNQKLPPRTVKQGGGGASTINMDGSKRSQATEVRRVSHRRISLDHGSSSLAPTTNGQDCSSTGMPDPSSTNLPPVRAGPRRVSLELGSNGADEESSSSGCSSPMEVLRPRNLFGEVDTDVKEESSLISTTEAVFRDEDVPRDEDMPGFNSFDTPKSSNRSNDEDVSPSLARLLDFSPFSTDDSCTPMTARTREASNDDMIDDPLLFLTDPLAGCEEQRIIDTSREQHGDITFGGHSLTGLGPTLHDGLAPYPCSLDARIESMFEDNVKVETIPRLRDVFDAPIISDDEGPYNQRLQDMIFLSSESTGNIMGTSSSGTSLATEDDMDISIAWSHDDAFYEEEMISVSHPVHVGKIVQV